MILQEQWIWTECWNFTTQKLIKEHFNKNLRYKTNQKSYKNGIVQPAQVNGFTIQKFKLIRINFNADFQYFFYSLKDKLIWDIFLIIIVFNLLKITFLILIFALKD